MLRAFALLFLLILPAACASVTDPGRAEFHDEMLSVDRARYTRGETARVRLLNTTPQPLGYNLCISARERWTGSDWRRIEPLRSCVAALFILEEGEEAVHEEPITAEWEPGRYRMVTTVERMEEGERFEVFSEPFEVAVP